MEGYRKDVEVMIAQDQGALGADVMRPSFEIFCTIGSKDEQAEEERKQRSIWRSQSHKKKERSIINLLHKTFLSISRGKRAL